MQKDERCQRKQATLNASREDIIAKEIVARWNNWMFLYIDIQGPRSGYPGERISSKRSHCLLLNYAIDRLCTSDISGDGVVLL